MTNYRIAIPSLKRHNALKQLTYKFLKHHNIPDHLIYIFVIDKEYETYKMEFPNCNIIVGRFGAKNNKNYITQYFKQGEYIVQLDDDIKNLYETDANKKLSPIENLKDLIDNALLAIDGEDCPVYGIYPIKNGHFMTRNAETLSTQLNYLCGAFLIYRNSDLPLRSANLIEDYEWSLLNFLKFGKVLRNNRVCIEANTYTLAGGLQYGNNRNKDNKLAEIKKLMNQYPEYVKLTMKSTKQPDIQFVNKKTIIKNPSLTPLPTVVEEDTTNLLHTYYTGNTIMPDIFVRCLNSWIKLEYEIILFTNEKIENLPEGNITCKAVAENVAASPAQRADLIRFKFLSENSGATWIDLDMFLVRKIPLTKNIISSEQPNRSGGYKSSKTNTPNIGLIRLENTSIFKDTTQKCIDLKNHKKTTCYMNLFVRLLEQYDLLKYVVDWHCYCPLDWSNMKQSHKESILTSKYGKEIVSIEQIKNNEEIIGIHMWASFIRKYNLTITDQSCFFAQILSL